MVFCRKHDRKGRFVLNIAYFSRLAEREYDSVVRKFQDFPYSFNDVMLVFTDFFRKYELYRGESHPPVRRELIRNYIRRMPFDDDGLRFCADIDPEVYPEIITGYFNTPFKKCDYRIAHFFSGDIRMLRLYEIMYE